METETPHSETQSHPEPPTIREQKEVIGEAYSFYLGLLTALKVDASALAPLQILRNFALKGVGRE